MRCPLCGNLGKPIEHLPQYIHCSNIACPNESKFSFRSEWKRSPIEKALTKRIKELEKKVK